MFNFLSFNMALFKFNSKGLIFRKSYFQDKTLILEFHYAFCNNFKPFNSYFKFDSLKMINRNWLSLN